MAKKITELTATSSVVAADVLPVVTDTGGTPTTKKATLTVIADFLRTLAQTFTGKTISLTDNTVTDGSTAAGDLAKSNGTKFLRFARGAADTLLGVNSAGTDIAYAKLVDANVDAAAAIAYSKMGTGTQTHGVQAFQSTVNTKGTTHDVQPKNVQTTDATVTTLDSFTLGTNTGCVVSALVVGLKSDGSQAGAYSLAAVFRRAGAGASQVGTTTKTVLAEDDSVWDATIDLSTNDVRVRVTGKAATTIQWSLVYTRLEVIP